VKYQIGEFSLISRFSIKTLRFYHEEGILMPASVDMESGYRYYNRDSLKRARIIQELKNMDFSLREIKEILSRCEACEDDSEIIHFIKKKYDEINSKIKQYRNVKKRLDLILTVQKESRDLTVTGDIKEKQIEPFLLAGYRFKGKYSELGKAFPILYQSCGKYFAGKPFCLYYDLEYAEEADIEVCFPLKQKIKRDDVDIRMFKGGRAVCIFHKGPYELIGDSYSRVMNHVKEKEYTILRPIREIYIKGPGILFRGNPQKYITEIQIFIS
jgi:DNA-binding transcriptional MerR regulator